MQSEEFEEIPWASLTGEQSNGIDKRMYLAAGVVGLLIIAVVGMRLLGGSSQPLLPVQALPPPLTTTQEVQPAPEIPTPAPVTMVVAEADLMADEPVEADEPVDVGSQNLLVEVTAEWFVTDWFTRDGSEETIRSIRAVLAPGVVIEALPHEAEGEPVTFVEWARAIEIEVTQDSHINVTVAYRAIRETDEGFVREPVAVVVISLVRTGDTVEISALPTEI